MLDFSKFLCDYFKLSELKDFISHIKNAFDFSLATFCAISLAAILNINFVLSVSPVYLS